MNKLKYFNGLTKASAVMGIVVSATSVNAATINIPACDSCATSTASFIGCPAYEDAITVTGFGKTSLANNIFAFNFNNAFLAQDNSIYTVGAIGANSFGANPATTRLAITSQRPYLAELGLGQTWVDYIEARNHEGNSTYESLSVLLSDSGDAYVIYRDGSPSAFSSALPGTEYPFILGKDAVNASVQPEVTHWIPNQNVTAADGDTPLKFSALLHHSTQFESLTKAAYSSMFAVGEDGLIYSWGSRYDGSGGQGVGRTGSLFRTPSSEQDSATPKPAVNLNDVLTRNGTRIATAYNGRGSGTTFEINRYVPANSQAEAVMVGEDGKLYVVFSGGSNKVFSLPNNKKILSMFGDEIGAGQALLGDDGKLYTLPSDGLTSSSTVDDEITISTLYTGAWGFDQASGPLISDYFNISNIDAWVVEKDTGDVWFYDVNGATHTWINYTTTFGAPKASRIVAAYSNYMAYETTTGQNVYIEENAANVWNGANFQAVADSVPRDLDGGFLDINTTRWTLMYQCTTHVFE